MECPIPDCEGRLVESGDTPRAYYWRCDHCHSLFIVTRKTYARFHHE
jgi:hypothetical protein